MDDSIPIPGTSKRIGIDPILGFLPGLGDAISACFGFTILYDAARCHVSRWAQFRIAINILINAVFGAIPIIGDLFSASFKSNVRNYAILVEDLSDPGEQFEGKTAEKPGFPWFAAVLIGSVLLGLFLAVAGLYWLIRQIF